MKSKKLLSTMQLCIFLLNSCTGGMTCVYNFKTILPHCVLDNKNHVTLVIQNTKGLNRIKQ
jgi:hypothetical protein